MSTSTIPASAECLGTEQARKGYGESVARLAVAPTGETAAVILEEMAGQAGDIAAQLYGHGIEGGDLDPLAWQDTAGFLRCLAAAERGLVLGVEHYADRDCWPQKWQDLASARTAAEYAVAVAVILAEYTGEDCDGSGDGDGEADEDRGYIKVRPGALARYREAADACTAARRGRIAW